MSNAVALGIICAGLGACGANVVNILQERELKRLDKEHEAIAAYMDWSYINGEIRPGYQGPLKPKNRVASER